MLNYLIFLLKKKKTTIEIINFFEYHLKENVYKLDLEIPTYLHSKFRYYENLNNKYHCKDKKRLDKTYYKINSKIDSAMTHYSEFGFLQVNDSLNYQIINNKYSFIKLIFIFIVFILSFFTLVFISPNSFFSNVDKLNIEWFSEKMINNGLILLYELSFILLSYLISLKLYDFLSKLNIVEILIYVFFMSLYFVLLGYYSVTLLLVGLLIFAVFTILFLNYFYGHYKNIWGKSYRNFIITNLKIKIYKFKVLILKSNSKIERLQSYINNDLNKIISLIDDIYKNNYLSVEEDKKKLLYEVYISFIKLHNYKIEEFHQYSIDEKFENLIMSDNYIKYYETAINDHLNSIKFNSNSISTQRNIKNIILDEKYKKFNIKYNEGYEFARDLYNKFIKLEKYYTKYTGIKYFYKKLLFQINYSILMNKIN